MYYLDGSDYAAEEYDSNEMYELEYIDSDKEDGTDVFYSSDTSEHVNRDYGYDYELLDEGDGSSNIGKDYRNGYLHLYSITHWI